MTNDFSVRMRYAEPPFLGAYLLSYTELGSCSLTKQIGHGKLHQRPEVANLPAKGSVATPTYHPLTFVLQESTHA